MSDENTAEFDEFWRKVKDATASLSEREKDLLYACVRIAWAMAVQEEELKNGFQGSFTPEQADMIVKYASGSDSIRSGIHLYGSHSIRSFIEGSISES